MGPDWRCQDSCAYQDSGFMETDHAGIALSNYTGHADQP